jgi:hypothetical protein
MKGLCFLFTFRTDMTQMALRSVNSETVSDTTPLAGPERQAITSRLSAMADAHFERIVLLVLFTLFLSGIYGLGVMMKMGNTLDQMGVVISDISNTSQGNRVVSCTDLSLQAPKVAASLPQCAAGAVR